MIPRLRRRKFSAAATGRRFINQAQDLVGRVAGGVRSAADRVRARLAANEAWQRDWLPMSFGSRRLYFERRDLWAWGRIFVEATIMAVAQIELLGWGPPTYQALKGLFGQPLWLLAGGIATALILGTTEVYLAAFAAEYLPANRRQEQWLIATRWVGRAVVLLNLVTGWGAFRKVWELTSNCSQGQCEVSFSLSNQTQTLTGFPWWLLGLMVQVSCLAAAHRAAYTGAVEGGEASPPYRRSGDPRDWRRVPSLSELMGGGWREWWDGHTRPGRGPFGWFK